MYETVIREQTHKGGWIGQKHPSCLLKWADIKVVHLSKLILKVPLAKHWLNDQDKESLRGLEIAN